MAWTKIKAGHCKSGKWEIKRTKEGSWNESAHWSLYYNGEYKGGKLTLGDGKRLQERWAEEMPEDALR